MSYVTLTFAKKGQNALAYFSIFWFQYADDLT